MARRETRGKRIKGVYCFPGNKSGSFAMLLAMRRASSSVNTPAMLSAACPLGTHSVATPSVRSQNLQTIGLL